MYDYIPVISNSNPVLCEIPSVSEGFSHSYPLNTVSALFGYILQKSPGTAGHCQRVMLISAQIGIQLNLSQQNFMKLKVASLLHDIGKLHIPDIILNKSGLLDKGEYEIMKTHCLKGFQELHDRQGLLDIADLVLYHHERYDGSGYPTGKMGNDIPLLSRIISVADAYDAMTSERSYKRILRQDEALVELEKNRFTQFDGRIVDILVQDLI